MNIRPVRLRAVGRRREPDEDDRRRADRRSPAPAAPSSPRRGTAAAGRPRPPRATRRAAGRPGSEVISALEPIELLAVGSHDCARLARSRAAAIRAVPLIARWSASRAAPTPDPMPADDRQDLRLLAIVPAYNEEGMIARVVRDIKRQAPDFNVLVVDDGSVDATVAQAEAEGAMVLRHPFNLGIGGAMQSGYKYALAHGYDVAVQVDGDGQHKPEYLPEMLDALRTGGNEADMVYGTRFRGDPGYKVPIGRRARQPDLLGRADARSPARRSPTRRRASGWSTAAASSCSPATTRTTTPRSRRS